MAGDSVFRIVSVVLLKNRILLVLILLTLAAMSSFAETLLTGDWVGISGAGQHSLPLRCHLQQTPGGYQGTLSLPTYELFDEPITEIESHPPKLILRIKKESATIELAGEQKSDGITGTLHAGESSSDFQMFRVAAINPEKYFGVFEFQNGKHLFIRTWDELGANQLTYFTDDGSIGALHAISGDSFVSGPGIWIPFPTVVKIQFLTDASGRVTGLKWKEEGSPERVAKKTSAAGEEAVTFADNQIHLAGSLVIPDGKGPFPAVVLIHGSGAVTRDFFGPIAYVFAQHGIAVLSYDKRGNGKSEGDWLDSDFMDLANDALAGIRFLKTRKEIDPHRIGMFGISQGGWIVPITASQSTDVSFALLLSTPSGTPIEQEVQSTEQEMKVQGASDEQIKAAVTKLRSQIDSLRPEDTKKELEAEVQKLEKEGNHELLSSNGIDNPRFLLFYRRIMDFDPTPFLSKLICPALVIYGEADRGVPVSENKEKLEAALKRAKNGNYLIRVFPKGNHALMLSDTGSREEFFHLNRFVPGFLDLMIDWMQKHTHK